MYDLYTGILRMMSDFRDDGRDIKLEYRMDPDLELLKNQYQLETLIGNGDELSKITNLLQWVTAHIYHKGNYDNHVKKTAMDLFEYAFDRGEDNGINCACLSNALTECYLSVGIKARSVFLMPCSPYDGDNHVVCEAWSDELQKWIMVDPTYGLYLMDEDGTPLNVVEIRERLAFQKELRFCEGYNYNGVCSDKKEIIEYYAKDFFYFQIYKIQGYDIENIKNNMIITIAPIGFDVKKRVFANIDYRIDKWGNNEMMQKWREYTENDILIYKNIDLLN